MKRIYFHIDELARDAVVASALKKILAEKGIHLHYGNRAQSEIIQKFDTSGAFDLCVFPNLDLFQETCPHPDQWTTPVIILPTESVGGTAANIDRLAAKYFGSYPEESRQWSEKVAAFLLWGESHYKAFDQFGPQLRDRAHVVGHPRFDLRCRPKITAHRKKSTIGIISRCFALNLYDRRPPLQSIYEGRQTKHRIPPMFRLSPDLNVEDRFYTEALDYRVLIDVIQAIYPGQYDIYVRPHPREDRRVWESLALPITVSPWDEPFMHWLERMDHVIGPVSTSFYDCLIAGKVPICTMDLHSHRQEHVLKGGDDQNLILDYVKRPKSMAELLSCLKEPSAVGVPSGLLHQEVNYPHCSKSLDSVAWYLDGWLKRGSLKTYAKHALLAQGALLRRGVEQSATFRLTRSRRRWIDAL